jgi:hypothetical protein
MPRSVAELGHRCADPVLIDRASEVGKQPFDILLVLRAIVISNGVLRVGEP